MMIPCDSTGVHLVRIFQIYSKNYANIGTFVKASIRETKPENRFKKKRKYKNIVIRTKYKTIYPDTSWICHNQNNSLILKKRLQPWGRVILGSTSYLIKKKKFLKSFVKVL